MVVSLQASSKLWQNLSIFISTMEHLMRPISASAGYQLEHFLFLRQVEMLI